MRDNALKLVITMVGVVAAIVLAREAKTLVSTSTVAPSAKPYDMAMYDVYSDLLQYQEQSWFYRLLVPQPEAVLIRVETEPGYGPEEENASLAGGRTFPGDPISKLEAQKQRPARALDKGLFISVGADKRFEQALDSAIADYSKRNTSILELQRKFNLPHYDQFTKAEEEAFLKKAPSACQKYAGYDRWVELSAVGFSQDQTVAIVHFINWRGHPCSNSIVGAEGKYRMLQNRGGKWQVAAKQVFSDWILDY
jgi:hypothetical protein